MTRISEKKDEKAKTTITRGQFLGLAWLGAGVLVAGEATLIGLKFLKPQSKAGLEARCWRERLETFRSTV